MSKIGLIVVILAILAILVNAARVDDNGPKAVCHAITEDSVITDCDYHDGTWWTK